ncbi:MAG: hypothetical protein LBF05_03160 [Tannerella sp.]|jgi:hypothetical protein|nr:hypothetical protein [Tannerella sp.]
MKTIKSNSASFRNQLRFLNGNIAITGSKQKKRQNKAFYFAFFIRFIIFVA